MSKRAKHITALLLSSMLAIGSVSGSVYAAAADVSPGLTSEIAEEVFTEEETVETVEAPAESAQTSEISEEVFTEEETVETVDIPTDSAQTSEIAEEAFTEEETIETVEAPAESARTSEIAEEVLTEEETVEIAEIPTESAQTSEIAEEALTEEESVETVEALTESAQTSEIAEEELTEEETVETVEIPTESTQTPEIAEEVITEEDVAEAFEMPVASEESSSEEAILEEDAWGADEEDTVQTPEMAAEAGISVVGEKTVEEGTDSDTFAVPDTEDELPIISDQEAISTNENEKEINTDSFDVIVAEEEADYTSIDSTDREDEIVSEDASKGIVESGNCGQGITWSLDSEGTLVISGNGKMGDFSDGPDGEKIQKIIISEGITSISNGAFGASKVKSVSIPSSVTTIGDSAFFWCSSLKYVSLSTGLKEIGKEAFAQTNLTSITIPSSVEKIGVCAFFLCQNLTDIRFSGGVKDIGSGAFAWCQQLTSVDIPYGTRHIGEEAFAGCYELISVSIADSVTDIGAKAFDGCDKLSSITIPSNVTSIGNYAFGENPDITIYGYTNSVAEEYAANNNIPFYSIGTGYRPIQNATITVSAVVYTGKELRPLPTVKLGDKKLVKDTDYNVSFSNNVNAGTATVTIRGLGKYEGTVSKNFKIKKAAQSITAKAVAPRISVGKTTTVSITGAKGTKSFKSSNTGIATVDSKTGKVTAKKVGTVNITATSAATANYNAASKTVTIKVVPAAAKTLTLANMTTGIKLTWSKVTGATGYRVYREDTSGKTLIKKLSGGSTLTYKDTTANTNGKKYRFYIYATAGTGMSTLSKSRATYRLTKPAVSSVTNGSASKMTVKWGKNSTVTGYSIQYSLSSSFASGNKTVTAVGASTVSKVIASLTKGKTYYVRIRTYKTVDNVKFWSAWSASKSVKIIK